MIHQNQIIDYVEFPPVTEAHEGILCVGGELKPEVLITAYRNGIFPWYNEGEDILWWCPDERCVVKPGEVKISKSMKPLLKSSKYKITADTSFDHVIDSCQNTPRPNQDGTWIVEDMKSAYNMMHELGLAHSIEVWNEKEELVGGLYGVSIGKMFYGESMFSLESNTSKIAFIHLSSFLNGMGFALIDCQVHNPHLESMGCKVITRNDFLTVNKAAREMETLIGLWSSEFEKYCLMNEY